jgi:hypothetical protein
VRAAELHSWAGASVAVVEVAANGEVVTGEESVTAASVCAALAWPQAARQGSTTLPVVAAVQGLHRPGDVFDRSAVACETGERGFLCFA